MPHSNTKAKRDNMSRVTGFIIKYTVLLSLDILLAQPSVILSDQLCMHFIIFNNLELNSRGTTLSLKLELLEMT